MSLVGGESLLSSFGEHVRAFVFGRVSQLIPLSPQASPNQDFTVTGKEKRSRAEDAVSSHWFRTSGKLGRRRVPLP